LNEALPACVFRVPAVYLTCANSMFSSFCALSEISNLRSINGGQNSDSPRLHLPSPAKRAMADARHSVASVATWWASRTACYGHNISFRASEGGLMSYVYLLRSTSRPAQTYIGFTTDLRQRLTDHNAGKSAHTRKFGPWRLAAYVAFDTKQRAEAFEMYLKSGSGPAFAKGTCCERRFADGIEMSSARRANPRSAQWRHCILGRGSPSEVVSGHSVC